MRSTKAMAVILRLDKIFSVYGVPLEGVSDNVAPLNSNDFKRYMCTFGIYFDPTTPKWPQGNVVVERFMQALGKSIKAAHAEHHIWQQELYQFLLQYRTTPHSTSQAAPAELIVNCTIHEKLPALNLVIINKHEQAKTNGEKGENIISSICG